LFRSVAKVDLLFNKTIGEAYFLENNFRQRGLMSNVPVCGLLRVCGEDSLNQQSEVFLLSLYQ